MGTQKQTLYEVLGVKPNAKHNDIGLAYNRLMRAAKREDAVPDLKYETRLREAFEVLSDLDRREQYDRQLAGARLKPTFGAKGAVFAAVVVVALAGGIYYFTVMKPAAETAKPVGKSPQEIAAAATPAVGRLHSIDMNGQTKEAGLAFAIESGVMVASCHTIAPQATLKVNMNPRLVLARVITTDEALGLCKLEVEGAGSWPLTVSSAEPRGGDIVYAASVNAVGEVVLKEGRVKHVEAGQRGRIIESTVPASIGGAPLLDVYGRVVAVSTQSDGRDRHVAIPSGWTDAPRPAAVPMPTPAATSEAAPVGKAPSDAPRPPPAMPNAPGSMTPERVEKLQKAFRPGPQIPADQDP
jgi:hypothetical protein